MSEQEVVFVEDVLAKKVGLVGYSSDTCLVDQTSVFANNKFVQTFVLIGVGVSLGWCAHSYVNHQQNLSTKKKFAKKSKVSDDEEERSPPVVNKKLKHRK